MQETISAADDNFTAVVSVHSMIFNNTFPNIVSGYNSTLKILSTWINTSYNASNIITIDVPAAQYSLSSLVEFLNTQCNALIEGFYYGLGNPGNSTTAVAGFGVTEDGSKATLTAPSAGTSGVLGVYNALHIYTGFFLIADVETIPLMSTLGLLELGQEGVPTNTVKVPQGTPTTNTPIIPDGFYNCIGIPVTTGGATTYYNFTSPWVAPAVSTVLTKTIISSNVTKLQGPGGLSISWEVATSNARESYNKLSTGNTIAIVPVLSSFGYRNVYEPSNPFKCVIPNFNVNQFKIQIRDCETGSLVDFQGSDWVLNLVIEFYEMDNTHKSEQANDGFHRNVMPNMHNTVVNHNLPFSGNNYYKKKRPLGNKDFYQ
jgi:hypothetical protein